jgi:hypothetical protein
VRSPETFKFENARDSIDAVPETFKSPVETAPETVNDEMSNPASPVTDKPVATTLEAWMYVAFTVDAFTVPAIVYYRPLFLHRIRLYKMHKVVIST